MPSLTNPAPSPHYHSINDLPIGQGPDKLALSEDVFPPPQDSSGGNLDIAPGTDFVTVDTTNFEPLLFFPSVGSVPDGSSLTIRIVAGSLSAILNPNSLTEGINGPPGSTFILDAVVGMAVFRADRSRSTWWLV